MSMQYDQYLAEHKANVSKGYYWIKEHLPELIEDGVNYDSQIDEGHDKSKFISDEYGPYDRYFYGKVQTTDVMQEFNLAWLKHIHRNPHHWQHWVLINDDPENGTVCIEMPYRYILEMICDWWAFSWSKGDLTEIFKWWNEHHDYIKLHENSRKTIEDILDQIKKKLEELSDDTG